MRTLRAIAFGALLLSATSVSAFADDGGDCGSVRSAAYAWADAALALGAVAAPAGPAECGGAER